MWDTFGSVWSCSMRVVNWEGVMAGFRARRRSGLSKMMSVFRAVDVASGEMALEMIDFMSAISRLLSVW